METIYIDVLIILNVYVNFFLLRMTAKITHSPLKTSRCMISSFYGSLFSLLILAPELPAAVNTLIKLAAAVTIITFAFGFKGRKQLMLNTAVFFGANMLLAGAVYGVYSWLRPDMLSFGNSWFYVDFSMLVLIITTAIMYGAVWLLRLATDKIPDNSGCYKVIVRCRHSIVTMDGLADTGNNLVDFFSGCPVIICSKEDFRKMTGCCEGKIPDHFRLIPCSTVSSEGVMPVFKPDEVVLVNTVTGEKKAADAMIGSGNSRGCAIFNPKLLK